jgi:hypothetical protein
VQKKEGTQLLAAIVKRHSTTNKKLTKNENLITQCIQHRAKEIK